MRLSPAIAFGALAACATVDPGALAGRHPLVSVDGQLLPFSKVPLPNRDGTAGDPYVLAAGHLDLSHAGRFELYQEYRNGRTGHVLARQSQTGTYSVSESRLSLIGDPQVYPSPLPNSWTGTIRPDAITVNYGEAVLMFRR